LIVAHAPVAQHLLEKRLDVFDSILDVLALLQVFINFFVRLRSQCKKTSFMLLAYLLPPFCEDIRDV
jgi:hypothetical protein